MEPLPTLDDDGLATPEVGAWAEEKYQLVRYYADIFSKAMARQFRLAYIDLFAAAGYARVRDSSRIIPASPLLVLNLPNPFAKYVFSELEEENAASLETRAQQHAPDRDVMVVRGDTNQNIKGIIRAVPSSALTFCFADPLNLKICVLRRSKY
jgi:three-Cys-motif partner protein